MKHSPLPLRTWFFALAALLPGLPVRALDIPEAATQSHQRMILALEEVARRTPDVDAYLGDYGARRLREQLARAGSSAPAATRFELHFQLGLAELNLGNEQESLEHLFSALQLFPSTGLPREAIGPCLYFLGVAHMRLGETDNCCRLPTAESCIFPIQGAGQHSERAGSEGAIPFLMRFLATPGVPMDSQLDCVWLLNIAHMTLGSYPEGVPERYRLPVRRRDLPEPAPFPRFPNVSADAGVNTFSLAGGVIADDFNGDGWMDLVVSSWDPRESLRYFQNDGAGGFVDLTEAANLAGITGGLNLKQADFDNDGRLDILVIRGAWLGRAGRVPNSLLRNHGPGPDGVPVFVDVAYAAGIAGNDFPSISAEWADYDLDGDLDLYVANEHNPGQASPSQLFRSDGPGPDGITRFTEVAAAAGVTNLRLAKGSSWGDYDGDRYPDLYVSNLGEANRLYRNRGDGTFEDVAPALGVTGPRQSFPVWFWDHDNDGHLDLFVSNYLNAGSGTAWVPYLQGQDLAEEDLSALYAGDGRGGFRDRAREARLDAPMLTMGSNFGDLDNDGYPDIYLGTGTPNYSDIVPSQIFRNRGGAWFDDVTVASGMGHLQKGHGVAFADFRNQGLLDIFSHLGGAVPGDRYYNALFRNPGFGDNAWIQVRLRGTKSNSHGVGSRIRAVFDETPAPGEAAVERSVYVHVNSGGSFGANPLSAFHLGLGRAEAVKRLDIFWPLTGETQVAEDPPLRRRIEITEGEPGWR